jgi:hypothetical protein
MIHRTKVVARQVDAGPKPVDLFLLSSVTALQVGRLALAALVYRI